MAALVDIGTVSGWATFAAMAAVAWFFWRGGGGMALSQLRDTNEVLESRVKQLEHDLHAAQRTIAELRAKTDVAEAVKPVVDAILRQEQQAQHQFERTLSLLDLIAKRLGPEE